MKIFFGPETETIAINKLESTQLTGCMLSPAILTPEEYKRHLQRVVDEDDHNVAAFNSFECLIAHNAALCKEVLIMTESRAIWIAHCEVEMRRANRFEVTLKEMLHADSPSVRVLASDALENPYE